MMFFNLWQLSLLVIFSVNVSIISVNVSIISHCNGLCVSFLLVGPLSGKGKSEVQGATDEYESDHFDAL